VRSTTAKGQGRGGTPHMPSDVTDEVTLFDRFAERASQFASKAWFFVGCVLLVLVWAPSYFAIRNLDTWQLIINTATTIITFLMVALLQNSQTRANSAVQDKLNALADGLADLMGETAHGLPAKRRSALNKDVEELRAAVGVEEREST
jgi:low affinity Fe/Cu permease